MTTPDADPRAEIRRRIIRRLKQLDWMNDHFGVAAHAADVADAVMELFAEVDAEFINVTDGWIVPSGAESTHLRLVLHTAPEERP